MEKEKLYQIKITLSDIEPKIWRRVLVSENTTFYGLHYVIQIAMGWTNAHLFEFTIGKDRIGDIGETDDDLLLDAEELYLGGYFSGQKAKFKYLYDFGDSWVHEIKIEKVIDAAEPGEYSKCTGGERACPPEDCGGLPGYYHLLEVLSAKRHPEKASMKEWLGKPYDPEKFDIDKINFMLIEFEDIANNMEDDDDDSFDLNLEERLN